MDQRLPGMSAVPRRPRRSAASSPTRASSCSPPTCATRRSTAALQVGAMAYLVEVGAARGADAGHPQGGRATAHHRRKSPRVLAEGCPARSCRRGSSTCSGCWSAASATAKSRRSLDITEGTVKLHVSSILGKLAVAGPHRGGHRGAAAGHRPAANPDPPSRVADGVRFDAAGPLYVFRHIALHPFG